MKHVVASLKYDVKINSYEDAQEVSGADLIVICAGKPRMSGTQISRRDLVMENAEIINYIAKVMPQHNHGAKYVIVTNPVDTMATLFRRVSKVNFTIGTGDHPDTVRFRIKLAMDLGVPVSAVKGYIDGEHGSAAYAL